MADEKVTPQLAPGLDNLGQFEQVNTRHQAKVARGVTLEQILNPAYWSHHAVRLRARDEIRAVAEDGSWIAELVVLEATRTAAVVKLLAKYDLARPEASPEDVQKFIEAHEVKLRGPHKWSVLRKSDGAVIHQGRERKEDAVAWLESHAKQYAGAPKVAA